MVARQRQGQRYTIVGIDPGTTLGLAMVDLDGNPVEIFSSKNCSFSDAVSRIISCGTPLVVASDVSPTPSMVKRISKVFSSHLHELNESLSVEDKIALTKDERYSYRNVHERDALAACLYAFKHYRKKFAQIRKKTPPGVDVDEVKALVIKGVSISAAIKRLIGESECSEPEAEEEHCKPAEVENIDDDVRAYIQLLRRTIKAKEREIEAIREHNAALELELEAKKREIEKLRARIASFRSEMRRELETTEAIRKRDSEIKRLRNKLTARAAEMEGLRRIIEELKRGNEPKIENGMKIKMIKSFTRDAILEVDRRYGIKRGDVIFLENGSGGGRNTAELLVDMGVSAVIYGKEMSHFAIERFFEAGIPVFSCDELPVVVRGGFAFVDQRMLNMRVNDWRSEKHHQCAEKRIVFV